VGKMNMAVVPAKNEQGRIGKVLTLLKEAPRLKNHCYSKRFQDNTMKEIKALRMENIEILYFQTGAWALMFQEP
jgi:hypothetical protein